MVEGTIRFQADSKQPWRYARYYVKRVQTGELAEAVVALRFKGYEGLPPRATVEIDQKNFLFQPETVAIRAGDSVRFTNSDGATHNVNVSSDLTSFNVTMTDGGSHTQVFERAGGIRQPLQVGCVFHSAMRAWIFVFDHPFYQVTQVDGRYRLTDVPPGEYDLEMYHPAGDFRWRQKVRITAGETTRVDIRVSPTDKK